MPAPTTITIIAGQLSVGLTAAALTSFDCQVVSAAVTAQAKLNTVPATFCAGESQAAAASGFSLELNVLQDWSDPDGISWFAWENDGARIFFEIALTDAATPDDVNVTMNGEAWCTAIAFGGDAGAPLQGTATWPCIGKPVKGPAAATFAALEADDELVDAETSA